MPATRQRPATRLARPTSKSKIAVPVDVVFTIDELAIYLKLPKRTLYKLSQEGSVPGHKVGRHWRFHRETIDNWLKQETPRGHDG